MQQASSVAIVESRKLAENETETMVGWTRVTVRIFVSDEAALQGVSLGPLHISSPIPFLIRTLQCEAVQLWHAVFLCLAW